MPTKRDLNRTTQHLINLGFQSLLIDMASGNLREERKFYFSSLQAAKAVQKHLYDWLWFHPGLSISTSLDKETATLTVRPRGKVETRGRRGEGKRR